MADISLGVDSARCNPTPFERALARYQFARDRLDSEPDKSDEVSDMLSDAMFAAERDLVTTPAASIEELRTKADIVWCDSASLPGTLELRGFFADLRRMTGDTPSRVFDPASWLKFFERRGGMWAVRDGEALLLLPDGADLSDSMEELDLRGGKQAVLDLLKARHEAGGGMTMGAPHTFPQTAPSARLAGYAPIIAREAIEGMIEGLIALLDAMDGDTDAEEIDQEDSFAPSPMALQAMTGPGCPIADSDHDRELEPPAFLCKMERG